MERIKTVTLYEFYYPDHRPDAPMAFAGNGLVVDHDAGDALHDVEVQGRPCFALAKGDGRTITVAPGWLWFETSVAKIKVKDEFK